MNDWPSPLDVDFPYWDETGSWLYFFGSEWDGDLASARPADLVEIGQLAHEALQALGRLLNGWRK